MTAVWDIWRYATTGRVKHALMRPSARTALCGVGPAWFTEWLGTGNQDEYDKLQQLPPCKRCLALGYLPPEENARG